MNFLTFPQILAQTSEAGGAEGSRGVPEAFFSSLPIDDIWQHIVNISWIQAVVCVAFALIYLIYGWRVFKTLVVINFAVLGLLAGRMVGAKLGSPIWGGILGTFMAAVVTWPFMKYCVSVMGALAGAILGGALWRTGTLPDELIWCGALAGLVAGFFLAFSSFKFSILLFTSLQGSVFLCIGVLALLNDYPDLSERIREVVTGHMSFVPILLIVPTVLSFYFQQRLMKLEKNWSMPS